ncbi:hypothetical protein [Novipirellula caenicola]|uniref:Uncharacterized protein n=1 Tax=Novipirellula caenicola TaxID=1536901 RepID=A0ABP9VKF8_9BACT
MNRFRWFLLLTVLALASVPLLLSLVTISGGSTFDSPDGRYRLSTWSKLSDDFGGKYTVELFTSDSLRPIRSVSVRVASTERTPVMRGGCHARWDMAAGTVDLLVDDRPELRLYFTSDADVDDTIGGDPSVAPEAVN